MLTRTLIEVSIASLVGRVADPKYQNWSHQPITFSRANQWANILEPGHFPLVLDPIIWNVRFEKVLIDGGSALDILFCNALTKLDIKLEDLETYVAPFWGVLSGHTSQPLGQITLVVQFGTANHFRIDYINFIVADFEGTYHAILGRPALAKFMAIPHYVYLLLKMPTKKGVLSLKGNVLISFLRENVSVFA
jgi:hypothetical protein